MRRFSFSRTLTPGLAAGVLVSVIALIALASVGVRGWRQSAASLAERRAHESANLLVRALSRDMRGVQTVVLSSPRWDQFVLDPPNDVGTLVASAFARYPYPESFFAWRAADPVVFFNRFDRPPAYVDRPPADVPFPVTIAHDPDAARPIAARIRRDADSRRTFSVFELPLAGDRYQVVARILYRDALRDHVEAVFGFTVNLKWVREHYFSEVTRQVARIGDTDERLALAVIDDDGVQVAGDANPGSGPVLREAFPMAFFDPAAIELDPPPDLPRERWTVSVRYADDPALRQAIAGANRTLIVATVAALSLGIGLVLTLRAARANARLADMRSDFVSAVTHEIKTPIATIRAIGDTMAAGRVSEPRTLGEYAGLVVQESKRLGRLVDNLLAFARLTDATEVYVFEPIDPRELVESVVNTFTSQLTTAGFSVRRQFEDELPDVRGDRTALELLFDNLVDNAIRYSAGTKLLEITVRRAGHAVDVTVRDEGVGIPADEIPQVTRKFVRGRGAGSGGSGLGLAIATRIAADHGGNLSIRSEVGIGTSVVITLPAVDGGAA